MRATLGRTLVLVGLSAISTSALAGPLTPPGAPAPTMKTLTEVEPRTAVNATNTPGDATTVYRITNPGSYYLMDNVDAIAGRDGIIIDAEDVTLDLNGFNFNGLGAGNTGKIGVRILQRGASVSNGSFADWDLGAVAVESGGGHVLRDLRATGSRLETFVFYSGTETVVTDCHAFDSGIGFGGIFANKLHFVRCSATGMVQRGFHVGAAELRFDSCTAQDNTLAGFETTSTASFYDCTAVNNAPGFFAQEASALYDCVARNNTTIGILLGTSAAGSLVQGCSATGNTGNGIQADQSASIRGSVFDSNGGNGVDIRFATGCVVDSNTIQNNGQWGIRSDSGNDNVFTRNMLFNNTNGSVTTSVFNVFGTFTSTPATAGPWDNIER